MSKKVTAIFKVIPVNGRPSIQKRKDGLEVFRLLQYVAIVYHLELERGAELLRFVKHHLYNLPSCLAQCPQIASLRMVEDGNDVAKDGLGYLGEPSSSLVRPSAIPYSTYILSVNSSPGWWECCG